MLLLSAQARANVPAASGLPMPNDGFGFLATDRSDVDQPGDLALRLDADYIRSPLVLGAHVVPNEVLFRAGLDVGVWNHLELGLWVPVTFDTYSPRGQFLAPRAAGAATQYDLGAGDLRLFLKVNAYKGRSIGLAFAGALVFPSGDPNGFRSDQAWQGDFRAIFDVGWRWFGAAFNVGARIHDTIATEDATGARPLEIGSELTWAAALNASVHPKLLLALEFAGSESLKPAFGAKARTAEALLSLRYKATAALHLTAGVGRSLAPDAARGDDVRVLFSLAWHPFGTRAGRASDADNDGVPDDRDLCPREPEDVDGFQDEDGCPDPDNDKDGIPDVRDRCPNDAEDKDGFEDGDGCPDSDNDGDGIPDAQDWCPNQPGPTDNEGCPDEGGGRKPAPAAQKPSVELPIVHFAHGSSELDATALGAVGRLADLLGAHHELKRVRLEGHASADEHNAHELSTERAQAVMRALAQRGVDPARLSSVGYGSRRPAGHSAEENRRVECIIVDLPGGTP